MLNMPSETFELKNCEPLQLGGFSVFIFDELESTNSYAKAFSKHFLDRSILIAESQISGKGRFDRYWQMTPQKDLCFTLILDNPTEQLDMIPTLSQLMCLTTIKTLQQFNIPAQWKWPNDVFTSKGKISGILCESQLQGHKNRVFCGMGINLGMSPENLESIDQAADSVSNWGLPPTPLDFLNLWLKEFEPSLPLFKKEGLLPFKQELTQYLAFLGEFIELNSMSNHQDPSHCGKLIGISPSGRLIVDISGKGPTTFHSGEVRLAKNKNGEYL